MIATTILAKVDNARLQRAVEGVASNAYHIRADGDVFASGVAVRLIEPAEAR